MKKTRGTGCRSRWLYTGLGLVFLLVSGSAARATTISLALVAALHDAMAEHVDQEELYQLVASGHPQEAFEAAFEGGDELFETLFNAVDGVGANVGDGQRFTRVPRADLAAPDEWASHFPERATGPNAQACSSCHMQPEDDGAGPASANVHRDPQHSAQLGSFIQRNTPHVFAPGALQRLAEEMTEDLHALRDDAIERACRGHSSVTQDLVTKGVRFGRITLRRRGSFHRCRASIDTRQLQGLDDDLVIRPFQWKGVEPTVRSFNRGASHNDLGMQAVEIVGDGIDGDFDGVVDEMTIGDQTALAIYPRPVNKRELAALGLIQPLSPSEEASIVHGGQVFVQTGCATCHTPELTIDDPIFSEPSQNPSYRDDVFPAGQDPVLRFVDPAFAVTFDLTRDQPDNLVMLANGDVFHLGAFQRDDQGRTIVPLFGDLKRHDMGRDLAENIDEVGTGASVWITKELWGVGSTAPYLHDGRATTLTEAILEHGGEAEASRRAFVLRSVNDQADLIAFLESLVLFKLEEEG